MGLDLEQVMVLLQRRYNFLREIKRVCGQGNIHFDIGHSVLCAALAFYQNRGSDPFDADATNGNISSVSRRLDIRKNH